MFSSSQIFIVTGASSGIGRGVALKLNELGASVIAVARRLDKLEEAKAESKFPQNFFCEQKNLAEDIGALPQYIRGLKDKYGRLHGLAYCAGIDEIAPLQMLDFDAMKRLFEIDYYAPIFMAKGFSDRRVNSGRGSSMLFISSIARICCDKGMASYSGAKAALTASLKVISRELAPMGMRVNSISPAIVKTSMPERLPNYSELESKYPFGFAEISDIAEMAAFMLSDKSKWITGQDYVFDCGSF